jgi:hypothetical protein
MSFDQQLAAFERQQENERSRMEEREDEESADDCPTVPTDEKGCPEFEDEVIPDTSLRGSVGGDLL